VGRPATESDRPEGMTLAGRRKATERLREIKAGRNAPPQCMFFIAPITALLQPRIARRHRQANRPHQGAEHDPIKLARILADPATTVGQVEVRGEFACAAASSTFSPTSESLPH